MRKILVKCPICQEYKRILLSNYIFENEEGSLLKYPVKKGEICAHQFIIVLDYHFSIRDYEIPSTENEFQKFLIKNQNSTSLIHLFNLSNFEDL